MSFDLVVDNGIIITMEPNSTPFIGSLGISNGKIEVVKKGKIHPSEGKEYFDATGKMICPGLINGHCHGDMTVARGIADDLTLLEQNERFAPYNFLYDLLSDRDRYYSRQLTYIEALKSGTTFMMENMYWSLGIDSVTAMAQTGIKGALAEDVRPDFMKPYQLITDEQLLKFQQECEKNGLIPVLGSISEEDFDEGLLEKIFSMASEKNILVTQHLAETTWRVNKCKETFDKTPVAFLYERGILSEKLIGSHAIYIDNYEIDFMKEAGVKVVNTPLCEMKIADGIAPIPEFLTAGVVTALGTDGALWNNSNDMFREIKGIVLLHTINKGIRTLQARQALEMATINGAKVFGMEERLGTISPGKDADFIVINTSEPHLRPLRMNAHNNVLSLLAFNVTGRDVESVFINGEAIVRDRKVLTVNEADIIGEVQATSERIAAAIPEDAFNGK
ncbi:amidohydrolase family protein [Bacillus sp. FJAT-50079]|uniref:amidohydrolase family protein n=1 Tax=Bacillus sp. FJAT-50079 TaxID=2833577 RepID=UPI001BC9BBA9|nr:amidohydrolase family protein [Bacillus sp. FJAT-50079]MBS4208205.1 amidohydrolase family protein [Bacillus sp. FJAT-50079]